MKPSHEKIIAAVLEKARRECPDALDLVGVYGSAETGDVHEKSDLDLLIVINDIKGYALAEGFILQDEGIGYDIYCTSWAMLESDAECLTAHLGRLMDSRIVYARQLAARGRYYSLRTEADEILRTDRRFEKVAEIHNRICRQYAYALTCTDLSRMRGYAAYVISLSLDYCMIRNGRYFRLGTKRAFEELEGLPLPACFRENVGRILMAADLESLSAALTDLLREQILFADKPEDGTKREPSPEQLRGTYEEMFSNWRNKMPEAAARGDRYSSFMNMAGLQFMLDGLAGEFDIPRIDALSRYDPDRLDANTAVFDNALEEYLQVYRKIGIRPKEYADVDAFVKAYLEGPAADPA